MTTSVVPAVLQAGAQLTTSPAVYVTGSAASQTIVKRAVFSNTTGAAVTITVWRVPSGGTPGVTNQIIPPRSVASDATDLAPELSNLVLNGGDTIQCAAGATTSINFFASGFVAT